MDNAVVFDLLLLVFILLFALIGFWRGVVKEGLAAGGILFGALLAENWSNRFAGVGSNVLNITADSSRFFTVETLLLAFTLVVGYGSGSMLVPPVRGLGARFGGAVIGSVNAAMLLAFSLRAVDQYIHRVTTHQLLSDSFLARILIVHFNWLLLAVTGAVLLLLFGRLVTERETVGSESVARSSSGRRPARLPAPGDAGKVEPLHRGFNAVTNRYSSDAASLEDLAPAPPISLANMAGDRVFPFRTELATGAGSPSGSDWRTIRFSSDATAPIEAGTIERCDNCGEPVTRTDDYCPLCGHILEREGRLNGDGA